VRMLTGLPPAVRGDLPPPDPADSAADPDGQSTPATTKGGAAVATKSAATRAAPQKK
jgi:hypothetical protein